MIQLQTALAQVAPEGDYSFFIVIGGMFLVMYFFMIRPQMKRQKEAKQFRDNIAKGDRVVTIGGIHGRVKDMNEKTVLLEVESGKIRVERTALNPSGEVSEQDLQSNA
jgi:preprotein translocase subunit YajC